MWPNGKAPGLGPGERWFDSTHLDCVRSTKAVRPVVVRDLAGSNPVVHPARVTQRIECQVPNLVAGGSNPPLGALVN